MGLLELRLTSSSPLLLLRNDPLSPLYPTDSAPAFLHIPPAVPLYIPDRFNPRLPSYPSSRPPYIYPTDSAPVSPESLLSSPNITDRPSPSIPRIPSVAPSIYSTDSAPVSLESLQSSPYIPDRLSPSFRRIHPIAPHTQQIQPQYPYRIPPVVPPYTPDRCRPSIPIESLQSSHLS